MPQADSISIPRPDDWHLHLRDGDMMRRVLPETARHFQRALVMPNLDPPVRAVDEALEYRRRITAALPEDLAGFEPWMTLYLTEETPPSEIDRAKGSGAILAAKLYPAGATTNSAMGVRDFGAVAPALERMAESGMPLCVHGEVVDPEVDIFDREAVFIDTVLSPILLRVPGLKVVLEHITTKHAVEFVLDSDSRLAATITVHHLIIDRNHLLAGGIRPHYYCLPVAKRKSHREALRKAATSGHERFFLGTDSAPHLARQKESACGCAGIFTAPNALSCLAHVFEEEGRLDRLAGFASGFGARFYGLPPNPGSARLVRKSAPVETPEAISTADGPVRVFDPGFDLFWHVEEPS